MKIDGRYYIWMAGGIRLEISKEEHDRLERVRKPHKW